jgi:hypothetical protein
MHRIAFLCFSLLILCLPAHAAPSPVRTCRILFLGAASDSPKSLLLFDGSASQEVELPRMNLSPIYQVPGGAIVLRLLEKEPANPEEIPAGAPRVTVGDGVGDIYLLVSHDPNNKVIPVSMQVINADQKTFRKGQSLWFNLTANRIGGKLGSEKIVLEPNSRTISKAPAKDAVNYPVELYYQIAGDNRLWPLCETQWQHNPAGRTVVFVITEAGNRVPRIMGFPDFRAEEEKEKRM